MMGWKRCMDNPATHWVKESPQTRTDQRCEHWRCLCLACHLIT